MRLGAAKAMVLEGTAVACPWTAPWPLPLKAPSVLLAAATLGRSPFRLRQKLEHGREVLEQQSLEHQLLPGRHPG
jgi:hypothetical protein